MSETYPSRARNCSISAAISGSWRSSSLTRSPPALAPDPRAPPRAMRRAWPRSRRPVRAPRHLRRRSGRGGDAPCRGAEQAPAVPSRRRRRGRPATRGSHLRRGPSPRRSSLAEQAPQHVLEDAAVAEVLPLAGRVEPETRAELLVVGAHRHLVGLAALEASDRELLASGQPERLGVLARHELAPPHPHHP